MRWIIYALFWLKVENRQYIPKNRNFIILANHISGWDPITIAVSGQFLFRPMAKKELYNSKFLAFILDKLGCIKVDRTDGTKALALARKALDAKETMLIFPEGTRSRTLKLGDFKGGAFALALKTDTPILPCQIIAPKGMKLFCRVKVRYDKLIHPSEIFFEEDNRHYERSMEVIRKVFIKLRTDEMPN
ncbi:MAG: 1-acyl-sn-glycerol-3-phosphate acyltransferase [Oscillospiraceae bacterium]|nr:1-acyl-sn-glycerol-3-phosphate acyltransferase [Oscillospiraceae bacterium]